MFFIRFSPFLPYREQKMNSRNCMRLREFKKINLRTKLKRWLWIVRRKTLKTIFWFSPKNSASGPKLCKVESPRREKITINVPLFKKLWDIIFFWWDNHFMSHFEGHILYPCSKSQYLIPAIIYRDIIYALYPSSTPPPKQQRSSGILRNQQQCVRYIMSVSGT